MKNYDEVAKSVLARRDAHDAAVKRRNKIALRVGIPVVSLCLAVSMGVGFHMANRYADPTLNVDDALIPGIDDTVDPDELNDSEGIRQDGPVPGGAMAGQDAYFGEDEGVEEDGEKSGYDGSDEIWIEPHWDEKELYTKYPEFKREGGKTYTTAATWIDADKLGDVLGKNTACGYDTYEEKSYEIGITVYSINGISTDAAVAVSYDGFPGQYAVYTDHWYTPATLGEFIDALNLRKNLTFGTIYHTYWEHESYMTVEYKIADPAVIWNMLLSDGSLVNVADSVTDKDMSYYKESMSVSVSVDILGVKNVSLAVTENGYLTTNILATRKLFYIGEEMVQEFIDYVEANFENVREDKLVATTTAAEPYLPDDVVVTAVTQTTPPYDPTNELVVAESVPAYEPKIAPVEE
ncbi:MAG: hypothetical protein IJ386_05140 [Clostridia bacterium]|nr:hypothetical protein [Clostridia bacterium]